MSERRSLQLVLCLASIVVRQQRLGRLMFCYVFRSSRGAVCRDTTNAEDIFFRRAVAAVSNDVDKNRLGNRESAEIRRDRRTNIGDSDLRVRLFRLDEQLARPE